MEPQPWTSYRRNRLVSEVSFSPMPDWSLTSHWSLKCLLCFYFSCWRLELFYFQPFACVKATVVVVVLTAWLALLSVCWGLTLTGPAFLTPVISILRILEWTYWQKSWSSLRHLILPWPQFLFFIEQSCNTSLFFVLHLSGCQRELQYHPNTSR